MPLTLVELYRAEMDPIRPNKELSAALSPASFRSCVYGLIKADLPFLVVGWLRLGGIQIALHLSLRTVSPQAPGVFALQSCYVHGASPEPAFTVSLLLGHPGWPWWLTIERALACPAVCLLL